MLEIHLLIAKSVYTALCFPFSPCSPISCVKYQPIHSLEADLLKRWTDMHHTKRIWICLYFYSYFCDAEIHFNKRKNTDMPYFKEIFSKYMSRYSNSILKLYDYLNTYSLTSATYFFRNFQHFYLAKWMRTVTQQFESFYAAVSKPT